MFRMLVGLLSMVALVATSCGQGVAEDATAREDAIIFDGSGGGGGSEPLPTQLQLWSLATTPLTLASPGSTTVTFKVSLEGNTSAVCAGTLSIINKSTNAAVYSTAVTLTGGLVTKSATVNFPVAADYLARVQMPAATACAGGIKSSLIRVLDPNGALLKVKGSLYPYVASEAGNGVMTFTLTQAGTPHTCSKAQVWIEEAYSGKRWSAFDKTITNVPSGGTFTVEDFLTMAAPNYSGSLDLSALLIPPAVDYELHVKGDSFDCSGEVFFVFTKKLPYEIVLLETIAPVSHYDSRSGLVTDIDADETIIMSTVHTWWDSDCSASLCVFHKGLPTLGVNSMTVSGTLTTPYEITHCSLVADRGADLILGLVNFPADMPTLGRCDIGVNGSDNVAHVSSVIHGNGSWATYALKVWVKLPSR